MIKQFFASLLLFGWVVIAQAAIFAFDLDRKSVV